VEHTELRTIALKVERDPRLAAGAGGIARYLADSAGMSGAAPAELQAATVAACLHAFESLTPEQPALHVRYALFADRIEIELEHPSRSTRKQVERLTKHFGQTTANT